MEISFAVVVGVAMAVTEWVKTKSGLVNAAAEWLALGLSFIVGAFYQYSLTKPVAVDQWFTVVFVGLLVSVSANGAYKLVFANKKE